jgi:hypothetical protein
MPPKRKYATDEDPRPSASPAPIRASSPAGPLCTPEKQPSALVNDEASEEDDEIIQPQPIYDEMIAPQPIALVVVSDDDEGLPELTPAQKTALAAIPAVVANTNPIKTQQVFVTLMKTNFVMEGVVFENYLGAIATNAWYPLRRTLTHGDAFSCYKADHTMFDTTLFQNIKLPQVLRKSSEVDIIMGTNLLGERANEALEAMTQGGVANMPPANNANTPARADALEWAKKVTFHLGLVNYQRMKADQIQSAHSALRSNFYHLAPNSFDGDFIQTQRKLSKLVRLLRSLDGKFFRDDRYPDDRAKDKVLVINFREVTIPIDSVYVLA